MISCVCIYATRDSQGNVYRSKLDYISMVYRIGKLPIFVDEVYF